MYLFSATLILADLKSGRISITNCSEKLSSFMALVSYR